MRMINADALLTEIQKKEAEPYYQHTGEDWCVGLIIAEGLVDEQPTIEPQKWIPVTERLPKSNGIYNVTRNVSDGFECSNITDTCYFDGSNTWHDDTRVNHGRKYLNDVVAWMPLPEPWKGDNNAD